MEEPAGDLEVDVLELMEKRLPRYVVNCLQAAGYDDLEVIASMDVAEGEKSRCISTVEEYIERRHKKNSDMLPPCCLPEPVSSSPFEFPPGHRVRICNFIQEVKQLYKSKLKPISKGAKSCTKPRKANVSGQESIQVPLSVNEVTCQVLESMNQWIHGQKVLCLSSLKERKHYSVNAKDIGNGNISVSINCNMCRTPIRSHHQKGHFGIQNWTRHVKRCAPLRNVVDPLQPTLFVKQSNLESLPSENQGHASVSETNNTQQVFH